MCRTQSALALLALCVGIAHSWDIAVSAGEQIIFYTNGTKTNTLNFISQNLTALVYDEAHNMMLYVDKDNDNDAICGYNLASKENKYFIERSGRNIHSLAFDPVTELLFFTDTNEKSINWISLKPGSSNNRYGNLLIKMDGRTPTEIAVDSCRGYIYWVNSIPGELDNMERARFNGSERKVMYDRAINMLSLAIDPQKQKIYYFDGKIDGNTPIYLNVADLNSDFFDYRHESILLVFREHLSAPHALSVSKDYIHFMNSSDTYQTVFQLLKDGGSKVEVVCQLNNEIPLGIATNYKFESQILELENCTALTTDSDGPFCVHGTKADGELLCDCTPGYTGERCDISVCKNYCLQGNCSFNDEGVPKCRCDAGYSGERCEVNACQSYCLNNGDCSLNEEENPVCQCVGNHEGLRCEAVKNETFAFTNISLYDSTKKNLTLADLLSTWRAPNSKLFVTVYNNYYN